MFHISQKTIPRFLSLFGFFVMAGFFFPSTLFAATVPAGVPKDTLWFSEDPIFVGDRISIFSIVYNSTSYRLSGTMELYDGTTTIGKKEFVVGSGGAAQIISFPWEVTPGEHLFRAVITDNELRQEGENGIMVPQGAVIQDTQTLAMKRFADFDANHNRIPDRNEPPPPPPKKIEMTPTSVSNSAQQLLPTDPVAKAQQEITATLPSSISQKAIPIIGSIEKFREGASAQTSARVGVLSGELGRNAEMNASSTLASSTLAALHAGNVTSGWVTLGLGLEHGEAWKNPFDYVKLFLLLIWHFILAHVYIFYVLLLLFLFKLISLIVHLFI